MDSQRKPFGTCLISEGIPENPKGIPLISKGTPEDALAFLQELFRMSKEIN